MTEQQYIKMCLNILNNKTWYRRITASVSHRFANEYKSLIGEAYYIGLIDQDTYNFLDNKFPRMATFYALPKVHKSLKAPPGRPIVSAIGSLTENASRFVDFFLTPHVRRLPSYVRDTLDLLKQIEGVAVPPDALLVTLDVEALYSSIPHEQGVGMVRSFLMEEDHHAWPFNDFVLK